ncbi:CAAX prenyl protease-like protein [Diaminobutyricimonas aerilata]|uniref:CAAX prenyl protease-like protein n=1 Tax=Diaminobutyricimonas aerilata TaxID=1162967 RepID=A0A2M9CHV3_9MICO|nr:CPBP family intramembrane glutamic endopeptidase [Diaminobutyricimonas aerilata]PJJ71449.1 CAAX prenyl protease-like protein [Diaminobutyricimonas aerilata]
MQNALWAVLVLVIGILVLRAITRERREYGRFKRMRRTAARQRTYRRWLVESLVLLGGLSLVVLLAAGGFVQPVLDDVRSAPVIAPALDALAGGLGIGIAVGLVVVLAGLIAVTVVVGRSATEIPALGDVAALIPRNRAELWYGAGLSLNAGVVEELLFRLALPALLFAVLGNGPLAFALASVLFGLLHLYQGAAGMAGATVLGLVMSALYVATGSILVPMALHAVIDLRSLVLLPMVVTKAHRIRA